MARPDVLAAVDLGSSSFHLLVGRVFDGQIYPLDALREPVRLGAGLTADKRLDEAAQRRALEALARFGERLRGLPRRAVRAVGTNALRVARNAAQFLREARAVLGFPIEVIAGREEARLIYLGVAHTLAPCAERRLVVDIGGGSTELIIGRGLEPELTESLYMGCVSWSLAHFPDGRIDKARMKRAEMAARQELAALVRAYRAAGWQQALASSGTARAVQAILRENGWAEDGITRDGLERLRVALIRHERADPERIAGLRPGRATVLPGGVAILRAVLDELDLAQVAVSEGALRHGLLYDLLGRVEHRDMREATVAQFMRRYGVDAVQAERVRRLALELLDALGGGAAEDEGARTMLDWAARLAEVGLSVAHAQYHKHSAYILANADMPGFSRMEQQRLARLVLAQRGKLAKVAQAGIDPAEWPLVLCLRLATLVLRSRADAALPLARAAAHEGEFVLELPQRWLEDNPLTAAAFETEVAHWKAIGLRLEVRPRAEHRLSAPGRRA